MPNPCVVQGSTNCAAVLAPKEQSQLCFSSQQDGFISDFICFQCSTIYSAGSSQGQLKVIHISEMSNLTLSREAVTFGEMLNGQTNGDVQIRD